MNDLLTRDGHLVNNWYIICCSSELKNQPLQKIIYDQKIVLFRDKEKKPVAMLDRCLHRAALLSFGTVKDGVLTCPYHSWSYDSLGRVINIPSEGPQQKSTKHKCNKVYPVVEKDGMIWIWMGKAGEEKLEDIWSFPYVNDKNWSQYFMVTNFENEVTNLVENFVDVPHTVSVHKGWFRNQASRKVPMVVETKEGRVNVEYLQSKDAIGGWIQILLNPRKEPMRHTDCFIFPNITRVDYKFGSNYEYIINSQCTPVGTMKTRVYTYIAYRIPYIGKFLKPFIQFYTRKVIEQDVWIMKVQKDNLKLENENDFSSTLADEPHLQIEKLRKLGSRGDSNLHSIKKKVTRDIWI